MCIVITLVYIICINLIPNYPNFSLFKLHSIICNNLDPKKVGIGANSKLLNSLKSQVVYLASAANILPTVQYSAQVALQTGWSVLLPTANGRARTLSSLLLNTGKNHAYRHYSKPNNKLENHMLN